MFILRITIYRSATDAWAHGLPVALAMLITNHFCSGESFHSDSHLEFELVESDVSQDIRIFSVQRGVTRHQLGAVGPVGS